MRTGIVTAILVGGLQCAACAQDAFPEFKAKVIDANIGKVCYAVTLADVAEQRILGTGGAIHRREQDQVTAIAAAQ